MNQAEKNIYRFGEFELDIGKRIFLHRKMPLKINSKAFDLLTLLVENNGRILEKDEILGKVWNGNLIEENNLTVQISKIRKVLNDTKENSRFLKTIPGRGYCFTADVEKADAAENRPAEGRIFLNNSQISLENKREDWRQTRTGSGFIIGSAILTMVVIISFAAFWATGWSRKNPLPFLELQTEPLSADSRLRNPAISPDGKYFAYTVEEAKGQSLWIQQINSAHAIPIVPPADIKFWGINFTPDSSKIYYSVFSENNPDLILYRISTLGGRPEQVKTDVGSFSAFSPDGGKIAFITSIAALDKTLLKVINSDGSAEKTLSERKSADGFEIAGNTVSWSPDGNLIAAIIKQTGENASMTITGINPFDGKERALTEKNWARIRDTAWLKDGSGLILTAAENRAAPLHLWYVEYPSGQVRQLTNDLESYENLSIAADNSILAVKVSQTANLAIAEDNKIIEKMETIATQSGSFETPLWSSANTLSFISKADGNNNIWQINDDGSNKKQLTKDAQIRHKIDFSESGNYFVFDSIRNGKVNLWRTDADGSNLKQITNGEDESFPSISKDGSVIIYQNGSVYGKAGIWKINADGTDIKEIDSNSGIRPQLAPDGKRVAFFFMDAVSETEKRWKIAVASIETGKILQKLEFPPTATQRFLRWTNDGKAIAFIDDKGDESSIIVQPLDQSKPFAKFTTTSGRIESFAWTADGKKIAVNTSIEIRKAVLIKNK